ncbi:MAG: phage integrase family protein [Desulfobacteraceae bacterium]|nr:phage integrase family protein [Desulfobacteraceae bacterium]
MERKRIKIRGPFKVPGRKVYHVEIDRKRRSLKTTDITKAKSLVETMKAMAKTKNREQRKEEKNGIKFAKFMEQYLDWAEKAQPTKTFKANRLALRKLNFICKDLALNQITAFHLDQMVAQELSNGLKVGSINCYIRHSKSVLGQAVKWKFMDGNPFQYCKQQRAEERPPKALDKENIDLLFETIDDCYDLLVTRAYLITGRSRSELVSLKWSDVDFKKGRYYITRTKTHLSKWYPLGSGFRVVLESLGPEKDGYVFWRQYHPDTITHKVKKYLVKAGLGKHSLHHLRHSFARLYLEAGGKLRVLQDLLGHAQYSTTEVYASIGEQHLTDEIERVTI